MIVPCFLISLLLLHKYKVLFGMLQVHYRDTFQVTHPDIQIHFLPSAVYDDGRLPPKCHAYQVKIFKGALENIL